LSKVASLLVIESMADTAYSATAFEFVSGVLATGMP